MADAGEILQKILAEVGVTGQEKIAYKMRLEISPQYAAEVLSEAAAGTTYIVVRANTVQSARRPWAFEPLAVLLPYEEYARLAAGNEADRG